MPQVSSISVLARSTLCASGVGIINRVLNAKGGDWGICEISLFSGDVLINALRAQDHLFTVLEKKVPKAHQPIIIGAVKECLNARNLTRWQPLLRNSAGTGKGNYSSPLLKKATVSIRRWKRIWNSRASCTIFEHVWSRIPRRVFWLKRLSPLVSGLLAFTVPLDSILDNVGWVKMPFSALAGKRSAERPERFPRRTVSFPRSMVDESCLPATDAFTAEHRIRRREIPVTVAGTVHQVVEDNFVAGRPESGGRRQMVEYRPAPEQ